MTIRDPRMDPESAKRLASGLWKHDYDMCNDMETWTLETWTLDKRKLNDKIAEAMLDRDFAKEFARLGIGLLDRMFGEGTAEAFHHKGGDRVSMRFNRMERMQDLGYRSPGDWKQVTATQQALARQQDMGNRQQRCNDITNQITSTAAQGIDKMALASLGYMDTFTNSGTTSDTFTITGTTTSDTFLDMMHQSKTILKRPKSAKEKARKSSPVVRNRLARLPFKVESGRSLLDSLQREFDRWAGPQMRLING